MVNLEVQVRTALPKDHQQIANLIYYEPYIHRHLDWRTPLDWLGEEEFWVAEYGRLVTSALACPIDPLKIAWIRLFASSGDLTLTDSWSSLWQVALDSLATQDGVTVAAITTQDWFIPLLESSGFSVAQHIVILEHDGKSLPRLNNPAGISIRTMTTSDLPAVAELDAAAFVPLWQNSLDALQHAFAQAGRATVAEAKEGIIGYQISTYNPFGGHLARLAVHPHAQRHGIGKALVFDLLQESATRGLRKLTVNTQDDNQSSLALYQNIGFHRTKEEYPVYVNHLKHK
jgi:ribosomal protein S18 acetylase RimI-like enzyme